MPRSDVPIYSIVVTRPRQQISGLASQLEETLSMGGIVPAIYELPLLELSSLATPSLACELHTAISKADLIVFVSPNAIAITDAMFKANSLQWPAPLKIGLTGGGSQLAIEQLQLNAHIIRPSLVTQWDSEGLWECLKDESWRGKLVVFVRGVGGRPWLAEQFKSNGASLQTFEVYQRDPLLVTDDAWEILVPVLKHLEAHPNERQLWLLTSSAALMTLPESFRALNIHPRTISRLSAVCSHARIAQAAHSVGFGEVIVSAAGDASLIQAAKNWVSHLA